MRKRSSRLTEGNVLSIWLVHLPHCSLQFHHSTAGVTKKWPDFIYISLYTPLPLHLPRYTLDSLFSASRYRQSLSEKVNHQQTFGHEVNAGSPRRAPTVFTFRNKAMNLSMKSEWQRVQLTEEGEDRESGW